MIRAKTRGLVRPVLPSVLNAVLGALLALAGGPAPAEAEGTAAAAAPATPSKTAAGASAPSLEDFARLPFIEDAELSPNGRHFAGILGVGGQRRICIVSLFDLAAPKTCQGIPDGMEAHGLRWVGNDNIVVRVTAQQFVVGGMPRWYISRLVGLNRTTGVVTRLLKDAGGQSANLIWRAHDGSPEVLIAAQGAISTHFEAFWPTVYRVNVETGHYAIVQRGRTDIMDWSADGSGTVRAGRGFDRNAHKFELVYRAEKASFFESFDSADYRKREKLDVPFLFLPGDHALTVSDDDKGEPAIVEMDMTKGEPVRTLFKPSVPGGFNAILDDAQTSLLEVRSHASTGGMVWLDPALAALQGQFDKAVGPDRRAHILSLSADRKLMLVQVDRPNSPGALFFYNVDGGRLQPIAEMNETLKGKTLAPISLVHYTARDGLPIEAVLTLPADRPGRNLPAIVLPHGGPWAHDGLEYDYWAQFLAGKGYAVIQPNFRGSTGYGEAFRRKGEGQMGLAMQDDLNDALKWLADQGIADGKRACLVGGSYGGYATMWGLERDADLWRCGISIAGVASLRREVNDFGDYLEGDKFKDDWKRMTPDFAAVSPANFVERIKAPLLLIHGKKDVTVDPGQSASMAGKLRAAGKTFDYVSLPLADHHLGREEDRLTVLKAMAAWLDRYNPADPAPK